MRFLEGIYSEITQSLAMPQNPGYLWAYLPPREIMFFEQSGMFCLITLCDLKRHLKRWLEEVFLKGFYETTHQDRVGSHWHNALWLETCPTLLKWRVYKKGSFRFWIPFSLSFLSLVAMCFFFFKNIHIDIYINVCEFFPVSSFLHFNHPHI